jgi:hypothetical protein
MSLWSTMVVSVQAHGSRGRSSSRVVHMEDECSLHSSWPETGLSARRVSRPTTRHAGTHCAQASWGVPLTLFFIGLVLSIPAAVLANLCTPWVKTRLAKSNSKRRAKRIEQIQDLTAQLNDYRAAAGTMPRLFVRMVIKGARIVSEFFIGLAFLVLADITINETAFYRIAAPLPKSGTLPPLSSRIPVIAALIISMVLIVAAMYESIGMSKLCRYLIHPELYSKVAERQLAQLGASLPQEAVSVQHDSKVND